MATLLLCTIIPRVNYSVRLWPLHAFPTPEAAAITSH